MQYLSTRSHDEKATSAEAVLRGLAPDGGLYVSEAIFRRKRCFRLTNTRLRRIS